VFFVFSLVLIFLMVFKLAPLVFLTPKRKSQSAAASRGKTVTKAKEINYTLFIPADADSVPIFRQSIGIHCYRVYNERFVPGLYSKLSIVLIYKPRQIIYVICLFFYGYVSLLT